MHLIIYPPKSELKKEIQDSKPQTALKVNAHIHTPYSFSAFNSILEAVTLAAKENVNVLGINDFFVTDGHAEFAEFCLKSKIFPLFNIEFIGLNKADQKNGIKINDPNNPGRTYISGKGLAFPKRESAKNKALLENFKYESQLQIFAMIEKLNNLINKNGGNFKITVDEIYQEYAKSLIRERHLAKVLRIKVSEIYANEVDQINFFTNLFGGKAPLSKLDNIADFENEIREKLLKAGSPAFVEENEKAFPDLDFINKYIIEAGGISTYPFLGDDAKGNVTKFEENKEKLALILKERGIYSVEFISNRNSLKWLSDYAQYFYENGFVVTFGTEHNAPVISTMVPACRDYPLSDELFEINYKGACVIAAHQYFLSFGETGYIDNLGKAQIDRRGEFEQLGDVLIRRLVC